MVLIESIWIKSQDLKVNTDNSSVSIDSGLGFFTWEPNVKVDNVDTAVIVKNLGTDKFKFANGSDSDDTEMGNVPQLISFEMSSGQLIYWDPQFGANDAQIEAKNDPSNSAFPAVGISVSSLFITVALCLILTQ